MPDQEKSQTESQSCSNPQDDDHTHIDENGVRQPNPPRVNMLKLVNHIEADKGGKHLKFPIASHPKGPYKYHIVVRVDTGADVNCVNEKTLLSHGATFRIGVLLPNYPEKNVVKGDNVPNFSKMNGSKTGNGTAHGTLHSMQNSITQGTVQ